MKIIDMARELITPLPSIFDLLVVGILGITFFPDIFLRGTFFIFYSLFLIVFTYLLKPKVDYRPISLILFMLWGLISIFIHNEIKIVPSSIMNYYFNVSFMAEGFIYIFCGVGLLVAIVRYSSNLKFIYLLLPISLFSEYLIYSKQGRMTPVLALAISVVIYLILKRKYMLGAIGILTGIVFVHLKWTWISFKFACRPYIWNELWCQIKEHPWVGSGFNHSLLPDNMVWVREYRNIVYGWLNKHNDLLNIGACLGAISIILILIFIVSTIKKIGIILWLIPILMIFIMSLFQMTFFEPHKAAICIVLVGISISESIKRRKYEKDYRRCSGN